MFAIQTYRFLIGSKIPFSDWPQIVQTFLEQQSLHYGKFLYYFENSFGACPKAIKNYPRLGPVRRRPTNAGGTDYLSNIEDGTGCTEAEIMALMPKIYRRYGFSNSYIIYQDVDFFSQNIPAIIQPPGNTPSCIKGSSITCYRDSVFPRWSSIDLRIIISDGHETFDPAPYFEAMKRLLPGIRCMAFVDCYMTEAEQQYYSILNQRATPLLEKVRTYFNDRLPGVPRQPEYSQNTTSLSLAPVLKKLCKQYGYTYIKYEYYTFFIQKRTANGHYLIIDIDTGKYYHEVNFMITYIGVGFQHRIADSSYFQASGADIKDFLSKCFEFLSSAEKEVIPTLDSHFPPTPDWFIPIM